MGTYAKTIVAVLTAALIAAQTALVKGHITTSDWITIALAALGALGVWAVPNTAPLQEPVPGKHELNEDV
jgi:hypothetical protein